jgi:DNA mismatch endonuclease (patch repair protein)
VIPGKGLAIFIDGDFWHGHQYQRRGFGSQQEQLIGINNSEYWTAKLSRNVSLDFQNTSALLNSGWRVLRFWESDIRRSLDNCVATTLESLDKTSGRASFGALADRTAVELFAGIGLVRLALHRSGWRTVFANCGTKLIS